MADPKNNGSKKWDAAVDRATGGGDAPESNAATIPVVAGAQAMIQKGITQAELDAITKDPSMEFAPQVLKLEEGDKITGILEGNGPEAELENYDKTTKEVTISVVKTWIIANVDGGQRVSILGTAQLDRKLPPFVGGQVTIVRGKNIETKNGQRVTDYLVGGSKLPDGKRRTWAMKPVLEAASTVKELPAGDAHHAEHASATAPAHAS